MRGKEPYDIRARDFDVCKLFGGRFCDGVEELAEWRARLAKTSTSEDFKLLQRSDEIHRGFPFLCCPDKICFARKGNQIHGFPPWNRFQSQDYSYLRRLFSHVTVG